MSYAGDVTPAQAWELLQDNPDAVLVDVRTAAEWRYVGVPDTSALGRPMRQIEWVDGTGQRNPEFLEQLADSLSRNRSAAAPLLFLCRSGQRSAAAARAATAAGYCAYNVSEGFEGPLDADGHRGGAGWRAHGLPWRQS